MSERELKNSYRDPEPEIVVRSCAQCRWCYTQDEGYSSYTVEGTRVYCLKNQHPSGPEGFDQWYGEDARMLYATECKFFTEGESVSADVDRDEADWKSDEPWWWSYTQGDEVQRALMDAFLAPSPPTPSNPGSPRA